MRYEQRRLANISGLMAIGALATTALGQEVAWEVLVGAPGEAVDQFEDMAVGPEGLIALTGNDALDASADFFTVALEPDGSIRWTATYDGPSSSQDVAEAITVDSSGNVIVVGRAQAPGQSSNVAIVKYDGVTGDEIWVRLFDRSGSLDLGTDVVTDAAGSVYVTGGARDLSSGEDVVVLKYDIDGTLQWSAIYDGFGNPPSANDRGRSIVVDANGDVLVTGDSAGGSGAPDYVTIKLDGSTGAELWSSRYNAGSTNIPVEIAVDDSGDAYVAGVSGELFVTIRYRGSDGAVVWQRVDNPGAHDRLDDLLLTETGVYVSGATDPDGDESNNNDNAYVARYDRETGDVVWSTTYGTGAINHYEVAHALVQHPDGTIIASGRQSTPAVDDDVLVLSLDPATGVVGSEMTWSGPFASGFDTALRASGAADDLVLAGLADNVTGNRDYLTLRLTFPRAEDLDGDGLVNVLDLVMLLAQWGACPGCPADLDGNGEVDVVDLTTMLAAWS